MVDSAESAEIPKNVEKRLERLTRMKPNSEYQLTKALDNEEINVEGGTAMNKNKVPAEDPSAMVFGIQEIKATGGTSMDEESIEDKE